MRNPDETLVNTLASWARDTNLTPAECAVAVLETVETQLIDVIATVTLPALESAYRQKKKLERFRKGVREKKQEQLLKKQRFLDSLTRVQERLDGKSLCRTDMLTYAPLEDYSSGLLMSTFSGTVAELASPGHAHPRSDLFPMGGLESFESLLDFDFWSGKWERDPLWEEGYKLLEAPGVPTVQLWVDPVFRARGERQVAYRLALSHIEESLATLEGALRGIIDEVRVLPWEGIEDPSWKGLVIEFRILARSFEEKMKIWDELERKVRKNLISLRRGMNPNDRRKVEEILKDLYIQADL